jgi:ribosomal protein S18 acetylase RimI-like enzyme
VSVGHPVLVAVDDRAYPRVVAVMAEIFGTGPERLAFYDWVQGSPDGLVLAYREGRRVLATGAALSFGATGWLGGIGVVPEARRRGLGTAVTRAAIGWLRERGAETTLLLASPDGQPVYERMGFVEEGDYVTYRAPAPVAPAHPPAVRPLRPGDRAAVLALDREATGEERARPLDAGLPRGALALDEAGGLAGVRVDCPWPSQPILARTAEAGGALVEDLRARWDEPELRLTLPAANALALSTLEELGFRPYGRVTRMRLGPPVWWRPERVWSVISLFCG